MSGLTKILIVLQLVFSLVVSVLLVLMVSKQENYKSQVDSQTTSSLAIKATLALKEMQLAEKDGTIAKLTKDNLDTVTRYQAMEADLRGKIASNESKMAANDAQIASLTSQATSLTNTVSTDRNILSAQLAELGTLRPQAEKLLRENAELGNKNNEYTSQIARDELAMDKLKEEVAQAGSSKPGANASPIDSGTQVTSFNSNQTPVAINGKVTKVDQSPAGPMILTSLGSRDGVKEHTTFSVFRNSSYIGSADVQTVTPEESVAIVHPKAGESVKTGDIVSSGD